MLVSGAPWSRNFSWGIRFLLLFLTFTFTFLPVSSGVAFFPRITRIIAGAAGTRFGFFPATTIPRRAVPARTSDVCLDPQSACPGSGQLMRMNVNLILKIWGTPGHHDDLNSNLVITGYCGILNIWNQTPVIQNKWNLKTQSCIPQFPLETHFSTVQSFLGHMPKTLLKASMPDSLPNWQLSGNQGFLLQICNQQNQIWETCSNMTLININTIFYVRVEKASPIQVWRYKKGAKYHLQ